MFGAYWVAASFVEETLIECVSRWFGAGGSVFGVRPALFCADAANKLANVWVVGRQWKPSSGFPHGAQSRDYVQRSAWAMSDVPVTISERYLGWSLTVGRLT